MAGHSYFNSNFQALPAIQRRWLFRFCRSHDLDLGRIAADKTVGNLNSLALQNQVVKVTLLRKGHKSAILRYGNGRAQTSRSVVKSSKRSRHRPRQSFRGLQIGLPGQPPWGKTNRRGGRQQIPFFLPLPLTRGFVYISRFPLSHSQLAEFWARSLKPPSFARLT